MGPSEGTAAESTPDSVQILGQFQLLLGNLSPLKYFSGINVCEFSGKQWQSSGYSCARTGASAEAVLISGLAMRLRQLSTAFSEI